MTEQKKPDLSLDEIEDFVRAELALAGFGAKTLKARELPDEGNGIQDVEVSLMIPNIGQIEYPANVARIERRLNGIGAEFGRGWRRVGFSWTWTANGEMDDVVGDLDVAIRVGWVFQ